MFIFFFNVLLIFILISRFLYLWLVLQLWLYLQLNFILLNILFLIFIFCIYKLLFAVSDDLNLIWILFFVLFDFLNVVENNLIVYLLIIVPIFPWTPIILDLYNLRSIGNLFFFLNNLPILRKRRRLNLFKHFFEFFEQN